MRLSKKCVAEVQVLMQREHLDMEAFLREIGEIIVRESVRQSVQKVLDEQDPED